MSELTYSNAMEALVFIQEMSSKANRKDAFNFATALLELTGAVQSDFESIRRDISELRRRLQ
jgi:hypothetical protein